MSERDETPSETPSPASTQLMPGANGGKLRVGNPGNRGGGRTPSEIRAAAREKFDKLIPRLDRIARAKATKDADRVRAIDVLGKYGMDRSVSIDEVRDCLRKTTLEIRDYLPRDQADALIGLIRPIWIDL